MKDLFININIPIWKKVDGAFISIHEQSFTIGFSKFKKRKKSIFLITVNGFLTNIKACLSRHHATSGNSLRKSYINAISFYLKNKEISKKCDSFCNPFLETSNIREIKRNIKINSRDLLTQCSFPVELLDL